jgi:hypothetical protein
MKLFRLAAESLCFTLAMFGVIALAVIVFPVAIARSLKWIR